MFLIAAAVRSCKHISDFVVTVQACRLLGIVHHILKDKQIMRYETAIRELNDRVSPDGIYVIPAQLSGNSPVTPSETAELTYGTYVPILKERKRVGRVARIPIRNQLLHVLLWMRTPCISGR